MTISTIRRYLQRRGDKGQALTEFALVVPMVVMILLFSVWFLELVQVRLKVQEAARYVAWEATAFKLHDYKTGKADGFSKAQSAIMKEAQRRYADLDSTTHRHTPKRIFSAGFSKPLMFLTQQQELAFPIGGGIGNMIYRLVMSGRAARYGLFYSSTNRTAKLLRNKVGANVAFGPSAWGFNQNGYVTSTVSTLLVNMWANRGTIGVTGEKILKDGAMFHLLSEQYKLLVDDWHLYDGNDAVGGSKDPGKSGGAYWKQVDRMYLMTKKGKTVLNTRVAEYAAKMTMAIMNVGVPAITTFNPLTDIVKAKVVSKRYGPKQGQKGTSGKVTLKEDESGRTKKTYDTSPACYGTSCPANGLKDYGKTLKERGEHFMGCKGEMKLGCTSTLSQDNPFGDYLDR